MHYAYMGKCPQPEHYSAAARENWDFVYVPISRRLKLHSFHAYFKKTNLSSVIYSTNINLL